MRLMLALALLGGCVPKKRFDAITEDADRLRASLASTEAALAAANAEGDRLSAELMHERDVNRSLIEGTQQHEATIRTLEATNRTQGEQLVDLSQRLASLGATTESAKKQKAELEALVSKLQTDASAAQTEAEAARERAAKLAAEREALAAEAARLQAEKAKLEARTSEYDALVGQLQSEIQSGQVTITELSGKLTVNMSNAILFDSGATTVKPEGKAALAKVASVLAGVSDREIRVEGHTDDVPVRPGASYPDNWALSALRASTVVGLLVSGGVDPLNVAAVGYGEHHPAVPNDTAANRATNRRTEIVLVPRLAAKRVE